MADLIRTGMERGIQATTIHETLVERYGFTGGYDSVKRFLRRNKKATPATVFLDHPPAETPQAFVISRTNENDSQINPNLRRESRVYIV